MEDDDQIYIEFALDRGSLKVINQIIAAGLDERGDPDAEEHHLDEAHRILDQMRDRAGDP